MDAEASLQSTDSGQEGWGLSQVSRKPKQRHNQCKAWNNWNFKYTLRAGHEPEKSYFAWASVTDLKRIEFPHSLCCDFRGYQQLVGQAAEFKFESKFEPLLVIWQSWNVPLEIWASSRPLLTWPSGSRREALWLCLRGLEGRAQTQVVSSRRQSLQAATGSLEENVLPLLRYWLSSGVTKVLKFRAATSQFFLCKMKISIESARSFCRPKQRPSLRSILWSFIRLWAKIWHRNKTACSELNPVQSSRSVLTTCLRKGRLLE